MCFLASLNAYSMRACLSITITTMVRSASQETKQEIDKTCSMYDLPIPSNSSHGGGIYDWNEELQVKLIVCPVILQKKRSTAKN